MHEEATTPEEPRKIQERFWNEYGAEFRRFEDLESLLQRGSVGDEIESLGVGSAYSSMGFLVPELFSFYCPNPICSKEMTYHLSPGRERTVDPRINIKWNGSSAHAITYYCLHCGDIKGFLLYLKKEQNIGDRRVIKAGEWPPSGAPLPESFLRIADDAKNLLIHGYRCELQGLGIGAAVYYRRVVELRHKDILKAIRKVALASQNDPEIVQSLDNALKNHKFSEAIRTTNTLVPRELFVIGKNPLGILHDLLSIAVHGLSDKESLAYAAMLREVLAELADRIHHSIQNADKIGRTLVDAEKAIAKAKADAKAARDAEA